MLKDNFYFDLQQFSDEGDPVEPGTQPQQQFVEKIDPVTKQTVKIPAELEKVLGHFISTTRKEIEGQYKPLLTKLESEQAEMTEIKSEYEKLKEMSMTAEERAQANAKKVIDEHEKKARLANDESQKWKGLFEKTLIRNDILSSFGDTKLFSAEQVAILFEREGGAFPSEVVDGDGKPTGEFETRVRLALEDEKGVVEIVEGTPKELFKKWIKLDRNSHHVMNDLPSGSGARVTTKMGQKYTSDEFMKQSPTQRLKQAREQAEGK